MWGIDPDEGSILNARRRYLDIDFAQGQLEVLPFADEFFDVVILTDVLEHVQDEEAGTERDLSCDENGVDNHCYHTTCRNVRLVGSIQLRSYP